MPRFDPFTETTKLPDVGEGYERAMLDLKLKGETKKGFHLAKDVAAFANHLGGTLLIGAKEIDGVVGMHQPLDEPTAHEFQKATSEAVRDRCSPHPLVDFARIPREAGVILAVNVWPYIGQPIGVAVKCKKDHDGFGEDAYVFPLRVGVDSQYMLPEQIPMFMLPEVRRAAILLHGIPKDAPVHVRIGRYSEGGASFDARIGEVDELGNAVTVTLSTGVRILPLDQVITVFNDQRHWLVVLRLYT